MIDAPHPELLTRGTIPPPMHGVNPRTIKGKAWWDRERQAAYRKYDYHCWACGVHKVHAKYHQWLEGHEIYDIRYGDGLMIYLSCCALCHSCHNFIHYGRLSSLYDQGKVSKKKLQDITRHGVATMKRHGIDPVVDYEEMAPWNKWRLQIAGEFYPPVFKTEEAWERHYGVSHAG